MKLLSNDDVSAFFDIKWNVVTEKDILTPSGDSFIPDRLIMDNNIVKIIDFKTGNKSYIKKHSEQVLKYKKLLSDMSIYSNVESYLLYTDSVEIIQVF